MQLKASILLMALVDISVGAVMVFRADRCNTNANRLDNWLGRVSSVQAVATTPPDRIATNTTFSRPGDGGVFRPVDVLVSGSFETGQIIMETDLVLTFEPNSLLTFDVDASGPSTVFVGGQADGDLNCDMGCSNNWGVAPSADLEGFYDLPSLPVSPTVPCADDIAVIPQGYHVAASAWGTHTFLQLVWQDSAAGISSAADVPALQIRPSAGLQLFLGDNATADCIAAESTGCGVCPTSCAPFTAAPDSAGSVGVTTVAATSGAPDSSSTANTASKGSVNVVVIGLAAVGGLLLCAFIVTCYCLARPAPDPFSNIGKWEPGNQILTISFENPAYDAVAKDNPAFRDSGGAESASLGGRSSASDRNSRSLSFRPGSVLDPIPLDFDIAADPAYTGAQDEAEMPSYSSSRLSGDQGAGAVGRGSDMSGFGSDQAEGGMNQRGVSTGSAVSGFGGSSPTTSPMMSLDDYADIPQAIPFDDGYLDLTDGSDGGSGGNPEDYQIDV